MTVKTCGNGFKAEARRRLFPSRSNRKQPYDYDKTLYKQRNLIERMFCRIKDFRRIATRFDRKVKNFLSAICLAASVIWWF